MINLIKSTFFDEENTKAKLIAFIQQAKILSFGSECEKFEQSFAKFQERKHAIFVNSGSSANLALIQAYMNLGILEKGEQVGVSALTWSTNVMPLIQLGLVPIPIDIELDTLNVSSRTLEKALTGNDLQAVFVTNLLGLCDDIDEIQKLCEKNKILLLEDNCESLGTVYRGELLGNYSFASTNSFYVAHHLSTIEGGMICTDDDGLADMLKIVRAHGWDRNLSSDKQQQLRKKYKAGDFYAKYLFYDLGFNLRPTEISGFLGNVQMPYLDEMNEKREANFRKITEPIYAQTDKYYPIKSDHIDFLSSFAIPVVCKSKEILSQVIKKCEGILEIRPIEGGNIVKQPFFEKYESEYSMQKCPNAQLVHDQGLFFGNNPDLTDTEIKKIIRIFTK
jgi:CDP-6-deoxy-D-xylo-4-hexulose-3-dehydrase